MAILTSESAYRKKLKEEEIRANMPSLSSLQGILMPQSEYVKTLPKPPKSEPLKIPYVTKPEPTYPNPIASPSAFLAPPTLPKAPTLTNRPTTPAVEQTKSPQPLPLPPAPTLLDNLNAVIKSVDVVTPLARTADYIGNLAVKNAQEKTAKRNEYAKLEQQLNSNPKLMLDPVFRKRYQILQGELAIGWAPLDNWLSQFDPTAKSTATQMAEHQQRQAQDTLLSNTDNPAGQMLINAGISGANMAGTALTAGVSGIPFLGVMGASSGAESGQRAIDDGYSAGKSAAMGVGSGAITAGIESFGGIAGKWGGKLASALTKTPAGQALMAKVPVKALEYIGKLSASKIGQIAGSGFSEGAEEFTEHGAQLYFENLVLNKNTPYDVKEALYNAGIGSIVGGVFGVSKVSVNKALTSKAPTVNQPILNPESQATETITQPQPLPKPPQMPVASATQANTAGVQPIPPAMEQIVVEYNNATNKNLVDYVNAVKKNADIKIPYQLSAVSQNSANRISEVVGFDVSGYRQSINPDTIRHIEKRHGVNGAADVSMANPEDVARIQYVLDNFDSVTLDPTKSKGFSNSDGKPASKIVISKRVNGTYYVVEAVPNTAAKQIQIVTAYKTKAAQSPSDVLAPRDTSANATIDTAFDKTAQQGHDSKAPVQTAKTAVADSAFINSTVPQSNSSVNTYDVQNEAGNALNIPQGTAQTSSNTTLNAKIPGVSDVYEFAKQDIAPKIPAAVNAVKNTANFLKETFAPMSSVNREAVDSFFDLKGQKEQTAYQLQQQGKSISKMFESQSPENNIEFIRKLQSGEPQVTPELQKVANYYRTTLDSLSAEIAKLNPDMEFRKDYFPNLWQNGNSNKQALNSILTKRNLEGNKSFLKKRVFDTIQDGIKAGYKPVTTNPQKLFEMIVANETKYITANKMFQQLKKQGHIKYVSQIKAPPDGYVKLDDRMANVYFKGENPMIGQIGSYYVQKDVGRMLNNYLAKNWVVDNPIGRLAVATKNTLTRMELAVSAFHYFQTGMSAMDKAIGLDMQNAINRGKIVEALKIPFAPLQAANMVREGGKLRQLAGNPNAFMADPKNAEWLRKNPNAKAMVDLAFQGGLKLTTTDGFENNIKKSAMEALKDGNTIGAGIRGISELSDQFTKPLFEKMIPDLKLATFMRQMEHDIKVYAPQLESGKMTTTELARKVVNHVDDVYGAMNYDNLNWNRNLKQALQVWLRSPTWWLGNVRMSADTINETIQVGKNISKGQKPVVGRTSTFLAGLALRTAVIGGLMTLAFTGEPPEKPEDFFFPKTGDKDKNGNDSRISVPGYFKSFYNMYTDPASTLTAAQSGAFNRVTDIINNRDFYGNYIYDPSGSVDQIAKEVSKYLGQNIMPFTIRNMAEAAKTGEWGKFATSFVGITGAPKSVQQTPFQLQTAMSYNMQTPKAPLLPTQMQNSQERTDIRNKIFKGEATDEEIQNAIDNGIITAASAKNAGLNTFAYQWKMLSKPRRDMLWDKASDWEKDILIPIEMAKDPDKRTKGFNNDVSRGNIKIADSYWKLSLSDIQQEKADTANKSGITYKQYYEAYKAQAKLQSGVDYAAGESLAKSKAQKKAVDKATPTLTRAQQQQLYKLFKISEKVWEWAG